MEAALLPVRWAVSFAYSSFAARRLSSISFSPNVCISAGTPSGSERQPVEGVHEVCVLCVVQFSQACGFDFRVCSHFFCI